MTATAGILLIGNELLTGKTADKNLFFLARELFAMGITLERVVICRDEVATIAEELRTLRKTCEVVFTTGGVGPTHDDVTAEGIAVAVAQPLVESPDILRLVAAHFGPALSDGHRRLALMPKTATLVSSEGAPWPTVTVDGIYMFPGVPAILRRKWPAVRERLRSLGRPFVVSRVFVSLDEFALAPLLREVSGAHPAVALGSYLATEPGADYCTLVTFDGQSQNEVDAATIHFLSLVGRQDVVRQEGT